LNWRQLINFKGFISGRPAGRLWGSFSFSAGSIQHVALLYVFLFSLLASFRLYETGRGFGCSVHLFLVLILYFLTNRQTLLNEGFAKNGFDGVRMMWHGETNSGYIVNDCTPQVVYTYPYDLNAF
jgi:hypothetical protein